MPKNLDPLFKQLKQNPVLIIFTNRVSREGKGIGSVRLSVRLFPLYLLKRLTFELAFLCMCHSHDYSSREIESQGHRSSSKVNVQRVWTYLRSRSDLDPRSRTVFLVCTANRRSIFNLHVIIVCNSSSTKQGISLG